MITMVQICHYTEEEILFIGLKLLGYDKERQGRSKRASKVKKFKHLIGAHPAVVSAIWADSQRMKDDDHKLVVHRGNADKHMKDLLMTMHFLRKYPTETDQDALFQKSAKTCRVAVAALDFALALAQFSCWMAGIAGTLRLETGRLLGEFVCVPLRIFLPSTLLATC